MAIYPQWTAPITVKMTNATFLHGKNYFLLVCFQMFNTNINARFKVSNTPTLMGWNLIMLIRDNLTQLQDSNGKSTTATLFQNNVTFRNPMTPTDLPKMLFYQIKQCQEIQKIGKFLYSSEQIITNVVRILI